VRRVLQQLRKKKERFGGDKESIGEEEGIRGR
jgi:hypothetical protein